MSYRFHRGPNRYICSVLDEMRKMHETRNYSMLLSLIEECQTLANRMEAGLEDARDVRNAHEDLKKLDKEIAKLREKKKKLEEECDK